jgi:hypothetical protein
MEVHERSGHPSNSRAVKHMNIRNPLISADPKQLAYPPPSGAARAQVGVPDPLRHETVPLMTQYITVWTPGAWVVFVVNYVKIYM